MSHDINSMPKTGPLPKLARQHGMGYISLGEAYRDHLHIKESGRPFSKIVVLIMLLNRIYFAQCEKCQNMCNALLS